MKTDMLRDGREARPKSRIWQRPAADAGFRHGMRGNQRPASVMGAAQLPFCLFPGMPAVLRVLPGRGHSPASRIVFSALQRVRFSPLPRAVPSCCKRSVSLIRTVIFLQICGIRVFFYILF